MTDGADQLFAGFFAPEDYKLFSNLNFATSYNASSGFFHALPEIPDFANPEFCACGVKASPRRSRDSVYLLENVIKGSNWAPCMLDSELEYPTFTQLRTLKDLRSVLADVASLESFMLETSPTFAGTLEAARKMVRVAMLTHSLTNIKVNVLGGSSESKTSEHIIALLRSFKAELETFLGLNPGPASEFLLIDSDSAFDSYNKYFRSLSVNLDGWMPLTMFNENVEKILNRFLLEVLQLDFCVTGSIGLRNAEVKTIIGVTPSFAELLNDHRPGQVLLHSQNGTSEDVLLLTTALNLHATRNADLVFSNVEGIKNGIIKPALETFNAMTTP